MKRLQFEDIKRKDVIKIVCNTGCQCSGEVLEMTASELWGDSINIIHTFPGDCHRIRMPGHNPKKMFLLYRPQEGEEIELRRDPPEEEAVNQIRQYGRAMLVDEGAEITWRNVQEAVNTAQAAPAPANTFVFDRLRAMPDPELTFEPQDPTDPPEFQEPEFRNPRERDEHHRRTGFGLVTPRTGRFPF